MRKSDACLDVLNLDRGADLGEAQFSALDSPRKKAVLSATPQLLRKIMVFCIAGVLQMISRCATRSPVCFRLGCGTNAGDTQHSIPCLSWQTGSCCGKFSGAGGEAGGVPARRRPPLGKRHFIHPAGTPRAGDEWKKWVFRAPPSQCCQSVAPRMALTSGCSNMNSRSR
jgi:hypothetical protein